LQYFRQPDVGTCLDYCPTGSVKNVILNECETPGLGHVTDVFFNKIGIIYKGLPFGRFRLSPGDELFHNGPLNTITRGLFFDGNSGHVKIKNIVLNTNFSIHSWVYFFNFGGNLLDI
jgi:hypothetical protein